MVTVAGGIADYEEDSSMICFMALTLRVLFVQLSSFVEGGGEKKARALYHPNSRERIDITPPQPSTPDIVQIT